jgi:hypothetical protein
LNDQQAATPTGPESRSQKPQQLVRADEAQVTRRVLLENGQLVPKGENLCLKSATSPETGGDESEKSNEKRTHQGSDHTPTNDCNLYIFTSDGVFGKHTPAASRD